MDGGFLYDFDEFVVLGIAAAQKTGQLLLLDRFLSLRTVRCRLAKRWDEMRNANTERVALALKLSDIPNPLDRLGEIVLAELDAPDTESSFVADRLTEIDELLSVSDVTAHQSCDYSALKVLALSKSNQSSQALELAERVYERCVTLDPPFWKAAFAFRCLGNVFLEHGNLDRAERMFIRLLDSTRPHNTSLGCFGLARCAIARVEPEIPALCCEILRQLGPQKAPQAISMRKELGLLYQEKFGRTIEIHSSWYSRWEDILSEVLRKLTHCDSDHSALCAPK
jgi:tetratricopeptide (TPR) repeat protein